LEESVNRCQHLEADKLQLVLFQACCLCYRCCLRVSVLLTYLMLELHIL